MHAMAGRQDLRFASQADGGYAHVTPSLLVEHLDGPLGAGGEHGHMIPASVFVEQASRWRPPCRSRRVAPAVRSALHDLYEILIVEPGLVCAPLMADPIALG